MAYRSLQKIRFSDVDGAGIVYYPKFFELCHAAFEDFFDTQTDYSYPDLIRNQRVGFPTVAIESTFTAPLEYGDEAAVELTVEEIGSTSIRFGYVIHRERDGVLCFQATITTVFISLDSMRPTSIPDSILAALDPLVEQGD